MGRILRASMLVSAFAVAVASAALAGPAMSLDDVEALLRAGVGESVILRQLGDSPSLPPLQVGDLIRLKAAGASDALLEQLQTAADDGAERAAAPGEAAPAAVPDADESSFRIFTEVGENGEKVLHITNLDPSGRRIGGPAGSEAPTGTNPYTPRDAEPYEEPAWDDGYERAQPPVVVNVFPPPQEAAPARAESPYIYRDPYAYRYPGGRLPGYYGCGLNGRGYARGVPSPPGSYSHYLTYHGKPSQLYNGALAYRSKVTSGHPLGPHYRVIGPASGYASITRYRDHFKNRQN